MISIYKLINLIVDVLVGFLINNLKVTSISNKENAATLVCNDLMIINLGVFELG
jgi:hypothetical protein